MYYFEDHLKTHTEEKSPCPHCNRSFSALSIAQHIRGHLKPKVMYVIKSCLTFSMRSNFSFGLIGRFSGSQQSCGQTFSTRTRLKKHSTRHHPGLSENPGPFIPKRQIVKRSTLQNMKDKLLNQMNQHARHRDFSQFISWTNAAQTRPKNLLFIDTKFTRLINGGYLVEICIRDGYGSTIVYSIIDHVCTINTYTNALLPVRGTKQV